MSTRATTVVGFDAFGGPERLHVGREQVGEPGAGQLRVANVAIGVNPADVKRLAGSFGGAVPGVLGFEAAGVVDAVGPEVEGFAPGDEVVWHGTGAQRELALARADQVRRKPSSVPFEQAAVLPVAAATAFSALVQADVGEGDVVLLHGASGGVGSAAVQIARALGARVVGTSSPANHEYLRSLGATPVAYGAGLVAAVRALGDGLDEVSVVVDLVGSAETVEATVELLGDGLTDPDPDAPPMAVTVAGSAAARAAGIVDKVDARGALDEVLALAEDGGLRLEVARRFALADAAAALDLVAGGHVRGKVVLLVDENGTETGVSDV
ncbi:quinone oxidoreductase family protein [Cellulosimicrobium marinum]|uniref:quinone oxidoreductase family protein n=1 Tax=Cellulosimicrobium marinum TaxID=1638992 RepID=UPI001E434AC2|nr:NADP-dependent oxidoreductase [Cellulosimicrobium marinum]MCB7135597.1 NADP-dependent oxidoreductase [Cellulosimicrobium marinum]